MTRLGPIVNVYGWKIKYKVKRQFKDKMNRLSDEMWDMKRERSLR